MEIEHIVYLENGDEFKSFLNSNWYDTATPYQFCIKELLEIKSIIANGKMIKIDSNNKIYVISNLDEFQTWIKKVFYGGFEKFVFPSEENASR
jgi:hypothetical protein